MTQGAGCSTGCNHPHLRFKWLIRNTQGKSLCWLCRMWPTSISFLSPPKHSARNVNSEVLRRRFSARLCREYPLIVYGNCVSLHRAGPARQEVRHRRIQSFFKKSRLPIISYVQTDKNKWFCSVASSPTAANTFKKCEQINTTGKAKTILIWNPGGVWNCVDGTKRSLRRNREQLCLVESGGNMFRFSPG